MNYSKLKSGQYGPFDNSKIEVRISDKMMRLVSLTSNPSVEPKVQDEKRLRTL